MSQQIPTDGRTRAMRASAAAAVMLIAGLCDAAHAEGGTKDADATEGANPSPRSNDWWIAPLERLRVAGIFVRDEERPYSTNLRMRDLTGNLSVSCEHNAGHPCGSGAGIIGDIDSATGYGQLFRANWRLRLWAGTQHYTPDTDIPRAFVTLRLGPIALGAGRDTFSLGPGMRTQLSWGSHAAPLDHVALSSAKWIPLGSRVGVNASYRLGRLRSPQAFEGNFVSITRAEVDIARNARIGTVQLLQLGGQGAPTLGFVDFLLEHVRRRDSTAGATDSSNRRFGADISLLIPELWGLRIYYELIFEDIRRQRLLDAIRYDADHLFGIELVGVPLGIPHDFVVEWHRTGVRSQEHRPRVTGFTNAGFVVGAPLGPDADSLYMGSRLHWGRLIVSPWFELARISSDTYEFIIDGPINRTTIGEDEERYRAGTRARVHVHENIWLEAEALFERVIDFGFEPGSTRTNVGASTSIVWAPLPMPKTGRPAGRDERPLE